MHTPIDLVRRNLLSTRAKFIKNPNFEGDNLGLLSNVEDFLSNICSDYHSIAFCWPYKDEPNLIKLLLWWRKSNLKRMLLLPKIEINKTMSFYSWSESNQLINNRFGIPEPDPNSKNCFLVNPDCILIPCVGWGFYQNQYWRLGYGGGYFDRTIFNLKNEGHLFKTVGIAYDWQKLNHDLWSPQDHDQPLDYVLTNSCIYPKV